MFPQGEAAKRLSLIEHAASALAELRVERTEPLVAIGGGALGDSAGFLAATYLRGIPLIHVPTTLVAQLDSSIGGKTAVDLPEGKNLVGAFHQPVAVIADVAFLRTLPERQRRAALGEAVKMAALGDERLFELLERDGEAIARGSRRGVRVRRRSPSSSSARPGPRSRSSSPTSASAAARRGAGGPAAPAGWPSTSVTRSATRSRRPVGSRRCSTARPSRTGCGRPAGSGVSVGVTPADRADRIERLLDAPRARCRAAAVPGGDRARASRRSTRSTPAAGCAGSCRRPTGSSSARTSRREAVEAADRLRLLEPAASEVTAR